MVYLRHNILHTSKKMNNIIYRVIDKKGKYQQSYSDFLSGGYSWAVECADLVKGEVYKAVLNENGDTESSSKVYPKTKDNEN